MGCGQSTSKSNKTHPENGGGAGASSSDGLQKPSGVTRDSGAARGTSQSQDGSTPSNTSVDSISQSMRGHTLSQDSPPSGHSNNHGKKVLQATLADDGNPSIVLPSLGPLDPRNSSDSHGRSSGQANGSPGYDFSHLGATLMGANAADKFLSLKSGGSLADSKNNIQVCVRVCPPREYDEASFNTGLLCAFIPAVDASLRSTSHSSRNSMSGTPVDLVSAASGSDSPVNGPVSAGDELVHSALYLTNPAKESTVSYAFDNCFWTGQSNASENKHMYRAKVANADTTAHAQMCAQLSKRLLTEYVHGYNVSLVTYGSSKTGKSMSLFGMSQGEPSPRISVGQLAHLLPSDNEALLDAGRAYGVLQHFVHGLFAVTDSETRVLVSIFQVLDDKAVDLMSPSSPPAQFHSNHLTSHEYTGQTIVGLTESRVRSPDHMHELIVQAQQVRAVYNADLATPSHAASVFVKLNIHGSERSTQAMFADLGSSDAVYSTRQAFQMSHGTAPITGIPAVRNVVRALAKVKNSHKKIAIPYNDSMLTFLLKQALGGNSKTVWLAAISPSAEDYTETHSTLQYANQIKKIVNNPVAPTEVPEPMGLHALADSLKERMEKIDDQQSYRDLQTKAMFYESVASSLESSLDTLDKLTQAVARQRATFLQVAGIDVPCDDAVLALSNARVALVNLHPDASLSEVLHFRLNMGVTVLGLEDPEREKRVRSNRKPSRSHVSKVAQLDVSSGDKSSEGKRVRGAVERIPLTGADIAYNHALLERRIRAGHYRGEDDRFHSPDEQLSIYPLDGQVYVNGVRIGGWTRLRPYDRIMVGMTHFFRVEITEDSQGGNDEGSKASSSSSSKHSSLVEQVEQQLLRRTDSEGVWDAQNNEVHMDDSLGQLPDEALFNILGRLSAGELMGLFPLNSRFQRVVCPRYTRVVAGDSRLVTVRFALRELLSKQQFQGVQMPSLLENTNVGASSSSSSSSMSSSSSSSSSSRSRNQSSNHTLSTDPVHEVPWLLLNDVWADGDDDVLWSSYERKLLHINVKTMHQQLNVLRQKRLLYGADPLSPFSVQIMQKLKEVKDKFGPFEKQWPRFRAKEMSERLALERELMCTLPAVFAGSQMAQRMDKHLNSSYYAQFALVGTRRTLKISREALKAGISGDDSAAVLREHVSQLCSTGSWFDLHVRATRNFVNRSADWQVGEFLLAMDAVRTQYHEYLAGLHGVAKNKRQLRQANDSSSNGNGSSSSSSSSSSLSTESDPLYVAPTTTRVAETAVSLMAISHLLDVDHTKAGVELLGFDDRSYGVLHVRVVPVVSKELEMIEDPTDLVGYPMRIEVHINKAQRLPKDLRNRRVYLEYRFGESTQYAMQRVEPVSRIEDGLVIFDHRYTLHIDTVTTEVLAYLQTEFLTITLHVREAVVSQKPALDLLQQRQAIASPKARSTAIIDKVHAKSTERLNGALTSRKRASSVYGLHGSSKAVDKQTGFVVLDLENLQRNRAVDTSQDEGQGWFVNDNGQNMGRVHMRIVPVEDDNEELAAEVDFAEQLLGLTLHYRIEIVALTDLHESLVGHPLLIRFAFHTLGNVISAPFLGSTGRIDIKKRTVLSLFIVAPDFINFLKGSLRVSLMLCPSKMDVIEEAIAAAAVAAESGPTISPSASSERVPGKPKSSFLGDAPQLTGSPSLVRGRDDVAPVSDRLDDSPTAHAIREREAKRNADRERVRQEQEEKQRQAEAERKRAAERERQRLAEEERVRAAEQQREAERVRKQQEEQAERDRVEKERVRAEQERLRLAAEAAIGDDVGSSADLDGGIGSSLRQVKDVEEEDAVMMIETPTPRGSGPNTLAAPSVDDGEEEDVGLTVEDLPEELPSPAEIEENNRKKRMATLRKTPRNAGAPEAMRGVLVGFAMMDLFELSYNIESTAVLPVMAAGKDGMATQERVGSLAARIVPVSETGLSADEDISLLVDDSEELLGRRTDLIMHLYGLGEMSEKLQPHQLYVQYQFHGDKKVQSTAMSQVGVNSSLSAELSVTHELDYERVLTFHLVNQKLLQFYSRPLMFKVYRDGEPEAEPMKLAPALPTLLPATPGTAGVALAMPLSGSSEGNGGSARKRRGSIVVRESSVLDIGVPQGVQVRTEDRRKLGVAQVELSILGHMLPLEMGDHGVAVFDTSGFEIGTLHLSITPLNSFGKKDESLFFDEPAEMLGQAVNLLVEVQALKGVSSRLSGSQLFLEYRFFGDERPVSTQFFTVMENGKAKVEYKRIFHMDKASQEYIEYVCGSTLQLTLWRYMDGSEEVVGRLVRASSKEEVEKLVQAVPDGYNYAGSGQMSMVGLSFGLDIEEEVSVVNLDGKVLLRAKMAVVPVKSDSEEQDEDVMVEDESELVGMNMTLRFKLHDVVLEAQKREFYVEFAFFSFGSMHSKVFEPEASSSSAMEQVWKVRVDKVTNNFVEYLQTGNLRVQLFEKPLEAATPVRGSLASVGGGDRLLDVGGSGTSAVRLSGSKQSTTLASSLRQEMTLDDQMSKEGWELIGLCPLYLDALSFNIEIESTGGFRIINSSGDEVGNLEVEITPEDDELVVDDPSELLGKELHFLLTVFGMNSLSKEVTEEFNEYAVRYTFFGDTEAHWTGASHVSSSKDLGFPRFNYDHELDIESVDGSFLEFTSTPMNMEVYGRKVDEVRVQDAYYDEEDEEEEEAEEHDGEPHLSPSKGKGPRRLSVSASAPMLAGLEDGSSGRGSGRSVRFSDRNMRGSTSLADGQSQHRGSQGSAGSGGNKRKGKRRRGAKRRGPR